MTRPVAVLSSIAAVSIACVCAGAFAPSAQSTPPRAASTTRVSVSATGAEPTNDSFFPEISLDGRYVTFESYASNLVAGDTNEHADIFIRDLRRPRVQRVSMNSAGQQANAFSTSAAVSAFGRYVAFASQASNLDGPNPYHSDGEDVVDVFVRDMRKGNVRRVSQSSSGNPGNGHSGLESVSISADGRRVVFASRASNLVPGDSNAADDIFVRDVTTGRTQRVSVDSRGRQANRESAHATISADGRFVAFTSAATNLVRGDTNERLDMFVRDLSRGQTRRVSVSSTGAQADAGVNTRKQQIAISATGRFVTFDSDSTNLVPGDTNDATDVFVRDTRRGITERVSLTSAGQQVHGISFVPSISATGRFVTFSSPSEDLTGPPATGNSELFLRDRRSGTTRLVSVGMDGEHSNAGAIFGTVSAVGTRVAFASYSSNLVPNDEAGHLDIFVRHQPRRHALGDR